MSVNLAIIDYGLGNVRSVANAFESLGVKVVLTRDSEVLSRADCLLLPGVGSFGDGMSNLKRLGLIETLNELVLDQKKPILGICLGMQLLARTGYENGSSAGLGWIDAEVIRFPDNLSYDEKVLKVPHVGWNDVKVARENPLMESDSFVQSFYFVHSYYMQLNHSDDAIGICEYGMHFTAAIQRDNIFAVQFHPEKSLKNGLGLLKKYVVFAENFARDGVLEHA